MSNPPRRLGRYELRQELGRGKTGEVWKAYDFNARSEVAIKLLYPDLQADSDFLTHFLQEGQTIRALHHPQLVPLRDIAVTRSPEGTSTTPYIAMDYIEGSNLAYYLQRTVRAGKFPDVSDIVYLFTRIGEAVDFAHEHDIVHGDITPNNILLNARNTLYFAGGEPFLADTGTAQLTGGVQTDAGKPYYLSPEQAKGKPATNASDIYALGVILYEVCTGKLPFQAESSVAILMHHLNTLPTPPILINPNIPAELSEVILRAMSKAPATRYSNASALSAALANACSINIKLNRTTSPVTKAFPATNTGPQSVSGFTTILGVSQPVPRVSRVSQPLPAVSGGYPIAQPRLNSAITRAIQPSEPVLQFTPDAVETVPPMTPRSGVPMVRENRAIILPTPSTPSTSSAKVPVPPRPADKIFNMSPLSLAIITLILLLIVVGSLAASLLFRASSQSAANSAIAGHVFFQDDALGHNDVLSINMQNIAAPSSGQQYVAWLEQAPNQYFRLGTLPVNQNSATLLYPGDGKHSDLLPSMQGVIITLESSGNAPSTPSLNNIVYKAGFYQPSLPYLKNLLVAQPGSASSDSLILNLYNTIKNMNDKTQSIVDSLRANRDYALVIRQATRVIEMIDGTQYAHTSGDQPSTLADQLSVPVGLISSPTTPGYLDQVAAQITKIEQTSGSNSELRQHAQNVGNAISDLRTWLQQMRTLDVQILKAPDITNPSLINVALQLKQLSDDAYTGRTIPPNAGPLPVPSSAGANQAYTESQYMAAMDVVKA